MPLCNGPSVNKSLVLLTVNISIARIGHTHLTHSYILKKDPPPQCERCQCILTVRHILLECIHFAEKKERYYSV